MAENSFKEMKKISTQLKKEDPFLMTVTVPNEKGTPENEWNTFLLINNFPHEELEGTKKMIAKLIDDAKRKK